MFVLAMGAPVLAQNEAPSFEELDVNEDGQISRTEAQVDERVAAVFEAADQNGDGALSAAEYAALS